VEVGVSDEGRIPAGTGAAIKISASLGIVAAMALAVLVNILVARHYRRWDWTRGGLYTLSDATLQTLHRLEEPIHVYVLLSANDPLTISALHLLESYRGETSRLVVESTDPDRRPADFLAVQQRFGIVAGRTEDGKIVTDAAIVVARGDVPHFITLRDLVATDEEDDLRRRPRLEQALTAGIRSVLSKERPKICFSTGHGEGAIEPGAGPGAGGLGPFRESLVKNNFEVQNIGPASVEDPKALDACQVLVIAGPTEKVPAEDVTRFKAYAEKGGSVFVAAGPVFDNARGRMVPRGLDDLLALFGLTEREDFIFELDPKRRLPQGYGEAFTPSPPPHAITEGLIKSADRGLAVVMTVASSLAPTGAGAAAPAPLLVTSDQAFGMVDFFTWSKERTPPVPGPSDHPGPLTVAFASELPKRGGDSAPHGPRMVAVGSASVLYGANWQAEELRGGAVFVESAIAWLAARPVLLDIPSKPAFAAGLRVSDAWLASTFRYVVLYIRLASVLLGVAVYLRRRSTERRTEAPRAPPPAPEAKPRPRARAKKSGR
jgi:hypothetical protein